MPRRPKGPRLYLRRWKGLPATWVIRDGQTELSTGCREADLAGAERRLADYIGQKHTPETSESNPSRILIADVVNVYLREHGPHVRKPDFLVHTAAPIIDWWGGKTLATIRGRTCRDYVTWRCAQYVANTAKQRKDGSRPVPRPVSDQTARHELKTLRAAVNYYHREYGPLDAVPAITLPEKAKPSETFLSRSDAARFLWWARKRPAVARFILIGLYTGTRPGDILGLMWVTSLHAGWVDLEHGLLYRKGRAVKDTKKSAPTVKIPDRLLAHMRRWHRSDMKRRQGALFTTAEIDKPWTWVRSKAGLGKDVKRHTMRHTCVTWRLRDGEPAWQVAGYVGMTVEMIDRVYGHHFPVSPTMRMNETATRRWR